MKDAELEKRVVMCCTIIGCFVPNQDYMPTVLAQLDMAADSASEAASLAVLTALTQGAGKHKQHQAG